MLREGRNHDKITQQQKRFWKKLLLGKDLEKVESDRADSKGEDMNGEKLEFKYLKKHHVP